LGVLESWCVVEVDERRALLYGPRFGRLYLLAASDARDERFCRVVGLSEGARATCLLDPVHRIAHDLQSLSGAAPIRASAALVAVYGLLRASRYVLPFRLALAIARASALLVGRHCLKAGASPTQIAQLVHAVERKLPFGDCYPRALLTAFLCVSARRACTVLVGVLAPTRKMHAWCSVDGSLPYEPVPEHYLYQPIWTATIQA
jgi:hypothetical protein